MKLLKLIPILLVCVVVGCGGAVTNNNGGDGDGDGDGDGVGVSPAVEFNPVGSALAFDLIDLEFLPDSGGKVEGVLVIGKDGTVYYLDANFNLVATNNTVFTGVVVDSGERGMLNVEAHPQYASNKMVYFYYTRTSGDPNNPNDDVNGVERRTVSVSGSDLNLTDGQVIIEFPKNNSHAPGFNHNGGGMTFDTAGNLIIGVGDGGGAGSEDLAKLPAPIAQDPNNPLGKIHRIIPSATPGVSNWEPTPTIGEEPGNMVGSYDPDSIYVNGVRNPFTIVNKDKGDQLFGDVGSSGPDAFEELNCLYDSGENYGWPIYEGEFFDDSCQPGACQPAAHGYSHSDDSFADEDPLSSGGSPRAIMVLAFIEGEQAYGENFDRRNIYSDFYQGWVRSLRVEENHLKTADDHIGHQEGLTSLQKNPDDLFYYGVSLGGSNQILKMELAP